MVELADIFRRYGAAYIKRFGSKMLPSHKRAMYDIINCRTEALSGHIDKCDRCGYEHYLYHSCCNRSCPKCHNLQTKRWLEKRRQQLLPVNYFHVTFTLPAQLRPIVRKNQRKLLAILMKAAAYALTKLAADSKFVGGKIGILSLLHTWARTMAYHPHVHCLVPAGALCDNGSRWVDAREKYLVPVKPLSQIFRARFVHLARKELPDVKLPGSIWKKDWVVNCKDTLHGPEKVLEYLARYVYKIAITNNRIISDQDAKITFRYKDYKTLKTKRMTLAAFEFIRRFLQHVLPTGFHKVRFYGIMAPTNRHLLANIKMMLLTEPANHSVSNYLYCHVSETQNGIRKCPKCKIGNMVVIRILPPKRIIIDSNRDPP
jgi:hypothetical protein